MDYSELSGSIKPPRWQDNVHMAPEVKFDRRALCSHGAVQYFRSVHTVRKNKA